MIILVTLMVAASRVLGVLIDDVPDGGYVAIDSPVPVHIDPATITRLYRDQSSFPVSSPPFNEGYYYSVPARLLLYQPPPGQSYPASRTNTKQRGNCDNQQSPITMGENAQIYQRHSYDQAGMSVDQQPSGNSLRGATQYDNHYDQTADYQHIRPLYASDNGFFGTSGHLGVQSYKDYPSLKEIQETPENIQDQYLPKIPVSYGNVKQTIPRSSQDQQDALVTQSIRPLNNRLIDSWPQSTGSMPDPKENYRSQSSENLYEKHSSGPNPFPDSVPQIPLYERLNSQKYGKSGYTEELPKTFATVQEGARVVSGLEYMTPMNLVLGSQSDRMMSHRGDDPNSYKRPSIVDVMKLQSPQISSPYLVGFKLLPQIPSFTAHSRPVWNSPNFPKHLVEPWSSKLNGDDAYLSSRYGVQSHLIESSPAAAPSSSGFRPPLNGIIPGTKVGTPWIVLMVPPESLFRKDYNVGMKIPWLSLDKGKDVSFSRAGAPPCQTENLNAAESQPSQSKLPLEIKLKLPNRPQSSVSVSWESQPLVGQTSDSQETKEYGATGSLSTPPLFTKPQFRNQQAPTQVIQDQTITADGNTTPPTVTKYITSDNQQLIEHTGEDREIRMVSQSDAVFSRENQPRVPVQTVMEGVPSNELLMHHVTSDSQHVADKSSDIGYSSEVLTEDYVTRPQAESMILESDSSPKTISYGDSGIPKTRQIIEELVHPFESSQVFDDSSGSNLKGSVDSSTIEQEKVSSGEIVVGDRGSSKLVKKYALPGDLATHRIIQSGSDQVSSTTSPGETPSSSKIVSYITSEEGLKENLGEADLVMRTGGSTTVTNYINSGSPGNQKEGPEIMRTQVEKGGLTSKVVDHAPEGVSGQKFLDQPHIIEKGQAPQTTWSNGAHPNAMEYHGYSDISGPQPATNVVSTATTILTGAPPTSKLMRVESSGGALNETLEEDNIALVNQSVPTDMGNISKGSTDRQHIVEEGLAPPTVSTLVEKGISGSQVIRVSDGSTGTTSQLIGISRGSEVDSEIMLHNLTSETGSQQATEEANGESITAILGGAPSSSNTIHHDTPGSTGIQENIGGTRISIEKGGPSTVTRYITTSNQPRSEQYDTNQSSSLSTIPDGAHITETINNGRIHNSEPNIARGNVEHVFVKQVSEPGTVRVMGGSNSSITEIIQVDAVPTGSKVEDGTVLESQSYHAFENDSNTTTYNISNSEHQVVGHANPDPSISTFGNGAHSSSKIIRYTVGGGKHGSEVEVGPSTTTQYEISSVTSTNPKVTTIVKGAPMTSRVIRYITTGNGERQEIVDEPYPTLENEGVSSVTHNSAGAKVIGVAPNSTSSLVKGAQTTNKIIRYIITADGQRQEIDGESSLPHESVGLSSVTDTNPASAKGVFPHSTTTYVSGSPKANKFNRYIITADGQRQEIDGESSLPHESVGLSSVTDTNPAGVKGVLPHSTTTYVSGSPTTKIIRYIITADGQRQEIDDESNLALENEAQASAVEMGQVVNEGNEFQSADILEDGKSGAKTIRYVKSGGMDQQHGQSMTTGNDGQSSVIRYFKSGSGDVHEMVGQDGAHESITTVTSGSPPTYKTMRYVSSDGEASNTNQPSRTITRYSTSAKDDASGSPTVTHYLSSAGGRSQFVNGQDNLQLKTIASGSTAKRYSMNYPQQSGSSGIRSLQSFQPQQTSTIIKPAPHSSGTKKSL